MLILDSFEKSWKKITKLLLNNPKNIFFETNKKFKKEERI